MRSRSFGLGAISSRRAQGAWRFSRAVFASARLLRSRYIPAPPSTTNPSRFGEFAVDDLFICRSTALTSACAAA